MVRNSIGESWSNFLNMRQHVARLTEALPEISFNEISSSKWEDDFCFAAGWLYLATKDQSYLNDLKNCPTAYSVHSWESVQLGAAILKGEITGDWGSAAELGKFQGNNYYFANEWGSARHNATAQLCSLVAAKPDLLAELLS